MTSTSLMSSTAASSSMNTITSSPPAPTTTPICGWITSDMNYPAGLQCATNQVCAYNTDVSILQCVSTHFFSPGLPGTLLPSDTAIFRTGCTVNPAATTSDPYMLTCLGQPCWTVAATVNNATLTAYECGNNAVVTASSASPMTVSNFNLQFYLNYTTYNPVPPGSLNTVVQVYSASPLVYYAQYASVTASTTPSLLGQSVTFAPAPTPVMTLSPTTTHSGAESKRFGAGYWIGAALVAGLALFA